MKIATFNTTRMDVGSSFRIQIISYIIFCPLSGTSITKVSLIGVWCKATGSGEGKEMDKRAVKKYLRSSQ